MVNTDHLAVLPSDHCKYGSACWCLQNNAPQELEPIKCLECKLAFHWFCAANLGDLKEPSGACSLGCKTIHEAMKE